MRLILQSSIAVLLSALAVVSAAARPLDGDAAVEDAILATAGGYPLGFEDQALYLASDVASRKADALTLHLASGAARKYPSTPNCSPSKAQPACVKYALAAYLRTRDVFVVAKLQGEDTSFLVVDAKTGRETTLAAPPLFSPNGELLVEYDPDVTNDPPVRLLRRRGDAFVPAWAGRLDDGRSVATFEAFKWRSNDAFAFKKTVWKRATDPKYSAPGSNILPTQVDVLIELQRSKSGWTVSAEAPLPQPRARLRWNWRQVWVPHHSAPQEPSGEPTGVTDVIFGRTTIMITGDPSMAGRISGTGEIRGAVSVPDGGAVLMIGRYDEAPLFPGGQKPACVGQEILLRDATSGGKPFPNGSATILIKQLPEECDRGLPEAHDD